jgi:hypothetical protein
MLNINDPAGDGEKIRGLRTTWRPAGAGHKRRGAFALSELNRRVTLGQPHSLRIWTSARSMLDQRQLANPRIGLAQLDTDMRGTRPTAFVFPTYQGPTWSPDRSGCHGTQARRALLAFAQQGCRLPMGASGAGCQQDPRLWAAAQAASTSMARARLRPRLLMRPCCTRPRPDWRTRGFNPT